LIAMMNALALVIAAAVSAVFLSAALAKLRAPRAIEETIRHLGFARAARAGAILLIVGELAVGVALLLRPDAMWTQLGVVVLASAFAAAAAAAIWRRQSIPCSCFGSAARPLGRRQLIAFIPFAAAAAVLRLFIHDAPPPATGMTLCVLVSLVLAIRAAWPAWIELRQSRSDRHAAEESYLWLPSR
jgi:hypothetical protein